MLLLFHQGLLRSHFLLFGPLILCKIRFNFLWFFTFEVFKLIKQYTIGCESEEFSSDSENSTDSDGEEEDDGARAEVDNHPEEFVDLCSDQEEGRTSH